MKLDFSVRAGFRRIGDVRSAVQTAEKTHVAGGLQYGQHDGS